MVKELKATNPELRNQVKADTMLLEEQTKRIKELEDERLDLLEERLANTSSTRESAQVLNDLQQSQRLLVKHHERQVCASRSGATPVAGVTISCADSLFAFNYL